MGRDRRQRRRRAAAVAGLGVAAKKHHDAKQAEEQPAEAQPPAPSEPGPPAAPATGSGLTPEAMEELKQLGELHEQKVLTDEEFAREKAKLLGSA